MQLYFTEIYDLQRNPCLESQRHKKEQVDDRGKKTMRPQ
jgi:hypothetical protein